MTFVIYAAGGALSVLLVLFAFVTGHVFLEAKDASRGRLSIMLASIVGALFAAMLVAAFTRWLTAI